jgi:hypothetical protein
MGVFSFLNPIITLYYGFILRIKLSWFSRQKNKKSRIVREFLESKLEKEKYDKKTISRITNNFLNIGEIFLDRKNMRNALSVNKMLAPRKTKTKVRE